MDKYKTFIISILKKFKDWTYDSHPAKSFQNDREEYNDAFTIEEQVIIHLNRRVESSDGLLNGKDVLIAELEEVIKLKDARMQKELDYKVKKAREITKLQEHIDCLENNPFRRIYSWVIGIVKYRIKVVRIGGK